MRGDIKTHNVPLQGHVDRLIPIEAHGFITTNDGREIYFHRNAVVGASFDDLEEGLTVELVVFRGDSPIGPHGEAHQPDELSNYPHIDTSDLDALVQGDIDLYVQTEALKSVKKDLAKQRKQASE